MRSVRRLHALPALALLATACGARTPLSLGDSVPPPYVPPDGGAFAADPCPFAVLPGAPKPMAGNCSTRDGRSRVPAPRAPHITWTLPALSVAQQTGTTLATDAANHVYVLANDATSFNLSLRQIDASNGTIEWTSPFVPGMDTMPTPFLPPSGHPELIATVPSEITTFDSATGSTSSVATPSLEFGLLTADPAIGVDGSLYLLSNLNDDGSSGAPFVAARLAPNGTIMWMSTELSTVATPNPPATHVEGFPSGIALGLDGTVLVLFDGLATPYAELTVVIGLDPDTGEVLWEQTFDGQALNGPVVAPDGSVAVVSSMTPQATDLIILEPTGTLRHRVNVPMTNRLVGVAANGTLVAFVEIGGGTFAVSAVDPSGNLLWQQTGDFVDALIASDGAVVAFGDDIRAFDLATGATRWSKAPPNDDFPAGVCSGAMTSAGAIVALQCNGTPFALGD
jgi:outer membrane protein assembly factor BamB